MSLKSLVTLALATGFAAAKPISTPRRQPNISPRQGFSNNGFNFLDGFNGLNNQQQIINIQENNLQIVDNGFQQAVVQQAQEVLIINEQNNGFNNQLNNLFRKSNFQNQFPDQTSVLMVVQEIQVAVDDGFGNVFEQNVFAQSVVVANRGLPATQTVLISAETLIAQDVIGNAFNNGFDGNLDQFAGLNAAVPTANADVQLFGQKPVWDNVAEDPAARLGGIWQKELEDLNNVDNKNLDNQINNEVALEEKRRLDEQKAAEEQAKIEEQQKQEEQQQQQQQQQEEEKAAAEEQQKQDEEQAAAEEQQKQDEEQAAAEEQQKQEEEQAAAEEQQNVSEQQVNTEVQA